MAEGERKYDEFRGIVEARRQYFDHWYERRGHDTKIMETDRALGELSRQARLAGLEGVFAANDAGQVRSAVAAQGGAASAWLTKFDDFLQVYGWRTEGSCDIALPSWMEDPTPAPRHDQDVPAEGRRPRTSSGYQPPPKGASCPGIPLQPRIPRPRCGRGGTPPSSSASG
ncbi:hypothetical protein [Prauserella flavalba]|uniref:Uncharacterized protein n=1 Tax=Prauserella flavalba TaxID=1477506 RepID=A0A318LHV8_9PSEU|nr:hypothetical protein BA062_25345 [Prauserella flavalba]